MLSVLTGFLVPSRYTKIYDIIRITMNMTIIAYSVVSN